MSPRLLAIHGVSRTPESRGNADNVDEGSLDVAVTVAPGSFIVSENGVPGVRTDTGEEHRRPQEYAGRSAVPRQRPDRVSDAMQRTETVTLCRADRAPRAAGKETSFASSSSLSRDDGAGSLRRAKRPHVADSANAYNILCN